MNRKNLFILGLVILIIITLVSFLGYFVTRKKEVPREPKVVEAPEEKPVPIEVPKEEPSLIPEKKETSSKELSLPTSTLEEKIKPLFDSELLFIDLIYPYIYVYDPQNGIVKYLNLDDKSYKELYKSFSVYFPSISPTRKRLILKDYNEWKIIDFSFDEVKTLKEDIAFFKWKNDDLIYFYFDEEKGGRILRLSDFKKDPLVLANLNLPQAKMEIFGEDVFVWADPIISPSTPIFSLNLKNPNKIKLIFDKKSWPSLLSSDDQKFLLFSYEENGILVSKLLDKNLKEIKKFSWWAPSEKCTFKKLLVCGVSLNNINYEDWLKLKKASKDKIVIYDPQNKEEKEIILNGNFDVLSPQISPLGLIFWNRNDAKLYVVNLE
jgi:hypothetical protein